MLTWEGQMSMDTRCYKNGPLLMETIYSCIDCIQGGFVKDRMPDQKAGIQQCAECAHHAWGDVASYGRQIYLIHKNIRGLLI